LGWVGATMIESSTHRCGVLNFRCKLERKTVTFRNCCMKKMRASSRCWFGLGRSYYDRVEYT